MCVCVCTQAELCNLSDEHSSLKEKMQVQRGAAAASLNRIQRQNQERCTELHTKIQELSDKIKEVMMYLMQELRLFVVISPHNNAWARGIVSLGCRLTVSIAVLLRDGGLYRNAVLHYASVLYRYCNFCLGPWFTA